MSVNITNKCVKIVSFRNLRMATHFGSPPLSTSLQSLMELSCKFETDRAVGHSHELLREAKLYFKSTPLPQPVTCVLKQTDPAFILSEILSELNFPGVCMGEYHDDCSSKKFLIDQLPNLYKLDVRTLFLENLQYDKIQEDLDAYFRGSSQQLPYQLEESLAQLDSRFSLKPPYTYTNLVCKAKEAGIRIVAIDTSVSAVAGSSNSRPLNVPQRILALNYVSEGIMRKETFGKFIAFIGAKHGARLVEYPTIPGIAELMQCPFVLVKKVCKSSKCSVVNNVLNYERELDYVHSVISLFTPKL